jgi:hypothetical protein
VQTRIAEIDDMTEDENREQGERDEGEEHVKGDRRDNDIPVVLLVFLEEFLDDLEDWSGFTFLNHNYLTSIAHGA